MFNCTEMPFLCLTRFNIAGSEVEGAGWFFLMLGVAFGLQVSANFIWLKNMQYSREILQLKPESPERQPLVWLSVAWTALSNVVWIMNVIFVMGDNLWMFLVIILGNSAGIYWASVKQNADQDNTIQNIILELNKKRSKLKTCILSLTEQKSSPNEEVNLLNFLSNEQKNL